MRRTVAVDLDGVLAEYDSWQGVEHFGEPIPGAKEFLAALGEFADVLIYTCRCNKELMREGSCLSANRIRRWLDKHNMTYHAIYTGVGKPVAAAYVDDRAVVCRPLTPQNYGSAIEECRALCDAIPEGEK